MPHAYFFSRMTGTGNPSGKLICLALFAVGLYRANAGGTILNCTETDLRNALVGGGSVVLACDSTITLSSTIVVAKETVLDGTGHSPKITPNSSTNGIRLFLVQPGASLILRHIALADSRLVGVAGTNSNDGQSAFGAAIYNDHGFVTLDGCTVTGHSVSGGQGSDGTAPGEDGGNGGQAAGAVIYNLGGQVTITNSTISNNSALGGAGGTGAVPRILGLGKDGGNGGDGGSGSGAAIYNTGQGLISIMASAFSSNVCTGSAAGKGALGTGVLGFPGKSGTTGAGGGGAVFNESGSISIVNSSFLSNQGFGGAGPAGLAASNRDDGGPGGDGGNAVGAAVYNQGGQVTLTNCTFALNLLTGGNGGGGGQSDASGLGGTGGAGGDGGNALGAGVCSASKGTTVVVNCTFSDNSVTGGQGGVGGLGMGNARDGDDGHKGTAAGGAVYSYQGATLQLRNSILANSSGANAGGSISDQGFNLSSDATPAFTATGSRSQTDPRLGSLTQSGGLTSLITLTTNSPAVDAITAADGNGAPFFDQRNAFRVEPYDIGAYELGASFSESVLQASLGNNRVLLSWPSLGNYVLQTTPSLSSSSVWTTVAGSPTTGADGMSTLAVAQTNQAGFFRLVSP